ncbi:MAG: hypothetical protein ACYTFW_18760 [Planctomycetota bacterium]|jgi:hypothetical protein
MYLINKALAVVSLKQPFADWANSTPGPKFTLESINRESHVFLLPEHDTEQELELIIQDLYRDIFEMEVASICRDEGFWPEINYQTFLDWFDIKVHSMVFYPYEDQIKKEEFLHY